MRIEKEKTIEVNKIYIYKTDFIEKGASKNNYDGSIQVTVM